MDYRQNQTITRESGFDKLTVNDLDLKRLNTLLLINAKTAHEKALYRSGKEKFESELVQNPMNSEAAFSYFGLMLGTLPPAAIFSRILFSTNSFSREDMWILGILVLVNLVSAITGYFSGKLVGKMAREAERSSWIKMLIALPLIGIIWGMVSGGAGGMIFFIFGGFFGAFFGAMVGVVALPLFGIAHRSLKKGDLIARNQFLPIAFGITLTICALILGI